ncbi:hypothetical protein RclHR1_01430022 [Rhizophagus clarus]|nr:hypothetical protein RclHR1_01430022 [Rhizophagus clarus]
MASIKVTYGQTSRKFTIPSSTTWSQFESQLHDLFNIPSDASISISYIDEDGDVITLSTDSELQQILSDQESFGTNVKFSIYTSENSDNNDWVLENAEEKDDSVATISDDEITSKKDDEIVAYNISEPSETENNENNENVENTENTENTENIENTESMDINQAADIQTEEQLPTVEIKNYPRVTVTDEKDDPLFEPTLQGENFEKQSEELLTPVDYINKEQNQENPETPAESSNSANTPNNANTNASPKENNEESEDDPSVIFIFSSRPYIQRTYYRPRVNLFNSLLNGPTYFDHFNHFNNFSHFGRFARPSRPRYSYITPSYGFRRNPYFGSRSCGLASRGFSGFGSGFTNGGFYHFGF